MEDFVANVARQYLSSTLPVGLAPYIAVFTLSGAVLAKTMPGVLQEWSLSSDDTVGRVIGYLMTAAALVGFLFCGGILVAGCQTARAECDEYRAQGRLSGMAHACHSLLLR